MIRLLLLRVALGCAMSLIYEAVRAWLLVKPVKRIRQWRTKRKMRSWHEEHGGPPDEILEDFNAEVAPMPESVTITLPDGSTHQRVEPIVKARTSTKLAAVGASVLASTAAIVIPNWDGINAALLEACRSDKGPAIGLAGMALMLVVNFATARLVKSPAVPGKL